MLYLGSTTTIHCLREDDSNYNYNINVLTRDGGKVFDVTKPQCYLSYCNATIEQLNANTKYFFDVQPVMHSMPQEPVEMGTSDWGIHNLGKTFRWFRIPVCSFTIFFSHIIVMFFSGSDKVPY